MKSGQFVFGMINGTINSYQSEDAEKLITEKEFAKLWNLGKTHGEGTYTYINLAERVIARSQIKNTHDGKGSGRKGTINHTIIYKFDSNILVDVMDYTDFKQNFEFNLPTLKNPLPSPPIKRAEP